MTFGWFRIIFLVIFGGTDIGVALNARYAEDKGNHTSYASHFAGALAGLMIGTVCLRNLQIKKWEIIVGRLLFSVYISLMLFAILWNALNDDYYPRVDKS